MDVGIGNENDNKKASMLRINLASACAWACCEYAGALEVREGEEGNMWIIRDFRARSM